MPAMRSLAVCLVAAVLLASGCGYGPEEPSADPGNTDVVRRPSGPEKQPTPPPDRPSEKPEPPHEKPKTQPKPPEPEKVPIDVIYRPPEPGIIYGYLGGALGAARRAAVMTELDSVNKWLKIYEMLEGRFPKDMPEMYKLYKREGGGLRIPPAHYKYFYWPKHGKVRMVRVTDERFSDPNGVHTLKRR